MTTTINAKTLTEADTADIIDVREPDEFFQERIAGSRNIPLHQIPEALNELKHPPRIIISCQSGARASQACEQLTQFGLNNIVLLEGGINGWKQAGHPTISFQKRLSVMQQVQITVGTMVILGTLLKPFWFLALIAGTGLLLAGITNTCMLATLLQKMPWNRQQSIACSLR